MGCKWREAWHGRCNAPTPVTEELCTKHQHECVSCGAPATHNCPETYMFVCGANLCDNCEHAIFPDGTNGGNLPLEGTGLPARHIPKADQKYKSWIHRMVVDGGHE